MFVNLAFMSASTKSSAEFQSQDSTVFAGKNKVVARKIYIMVCTGFWTGEFG